jgi:gamma-glutamyltranspeptidase/glutathione hydrolase
MVVGPHPVAAQAGLETLQAGGNAFDAIVAAAFTEAVVEPAHNGVAGYGGAAVGYHVGEQRVVCVDYNTEAPRAAHPSMFEVVPGVDGMYLVRDGRHKEGPKAVGIPGVVAGLEEIHRSWGTLSLEQVIAPAIRAATEGWPCNFMTARNLAENEDALRERHPETARLLMPDGKMPERGDRMMNPELGEVLRILSTAGLRDFYEGSVAATIAAYFQAEGGILTAEDLAGYRARHVPTTSGDFQGRTLHTPPVGCGGVTSIQMLQVLEPDLATVRPGEAEFYHLFAEVMKVCWRRRLLELGDAAFTGVPEATHLDPTLIRELRADAAAGRKDPQRGDRIAPEPFSCTSQLCAADAAGNIVSLTQTHGGSFGSFVTVPGTGLTFGHGMARFDPRPGLPNSIAPGKRPLHNMAPMIALEGERPVAAFGTPGGRTIVNNQAYFALQLFGYQTDIAETLARPRLHCEELEPLKLEEAADDELFAALRTLGHQVEAVERNGGSAQGIVVGDSPTELDGATDPRGDGSVAFA